MRVADSVGTAEIVPLLLNDGVCWGVRPVSDLLFEEVRDAVRKPVSESVRLGVAVSEGEDDKVGRVDKLNVPESWLVRLMLRENDTVMDSDDDFATLSLVTE